MKRIITLLLAMILVISLIACGKEDLEVYKEAVNKTNEIKKGQLLYEVNIEQEFNIDGLTSEDIKELNYFKKIHNKTQVQFDDEKDMVIARNYHVFGGMGFDTALYINGDNAFMKMPIMGKYMVIDELNIEDEKMYEDNQFISQETTEKISDKWLNLLGKEDVVSGKKTLLNTEDGEVKATLFTISLTENQLKELILGSMEVVMKDGNFFNTMSKWVYTDNEDFSIEEFITEMVKEIYSCKIKNFKYEVYIDIDGYIVQTNMEIDIEYPNAGSGDLKFQKISVMDKRWDFEEEQSFDFPTLTEENTLKTDEIDQEIPYIFEDFFKKEEGGK